MQIVKAPSELRFYGGKVAVTLGMFDGVHVGHQHIIRQTLTEAKRIGGVTLLITFDRHPDAVLAPARAPLLIQPLWHKLRTIESLGIDYVWLITFDIQFSLQNADTFIRGLANALGSFKCFCVGKDFVFGHGRQGDLSVLNKLGSELQFEVCGLQPVLIDGRPVSSTRIRGVIKEGDFGKASQLLGRPYVLAGTVVHGAGLGRTMGFPTANIDVTGIVLPPNGVYAAYARIGSEKSRAAVNIGYRPTMHAGATTKTVEAHLLDITGDFYARQIELELVSKLRDERAFPSLAALRNQIAADIEEVSRQLQNQP